MLFKLLWILPISLQTIQFILYVGRDHHLVSAERENEFCFDGGRLVLMFQWKDVLGTFLSLVPINPYLCPIKLVSSKPKVVMNQIFVLLNRFYKVTHDQVQFIYWNLLV